LIRRHGMTLLKDCVADVAVEANLELKHQEELEKI
jgi:hypothetical protein